jgi:hypothetical protein
VDSVTELQEAFHELEAFVADYDPISLLSQLTLTFLFVPENEFQSETSDVFTWQRQIEFLAAFVLVRPSESTATVDGIALTRLEKLLERYFNAVTRELVFESAGRQETLERDLLLTEARIESLFVRGDAYPHQLYAFAQGLYGPHDGWFREHYGFTIAEGINLSEAIGTEYSGRCDRSHEEARTEARSQADELIANGQAAEGQRRDLETTIGCALHFGQAEKLLAFSAGDLSKSSGVPVQTCQRFLDRMSQGFGYRNPSFPESFTDPAKAPWDYNALNERPIVTHGGRYWLFVPPLLPSSMFSTFYFDLMGDDSYRPVFEKARGIYVEKKTAECLRRVFPPDMALLNPVYPNGEEMADVIVLHDHKILLLQCKSKTLTYFARIGADFDALRNDLRKAIADAFKQGVRAREYLKGSRAAEFAAEGRRFEIDMKQVNQVHLVSVTAMPFQTLAARLANTNAALGLFPDNEYPWSLSLGDLDVVTQVLDTPAQFLHYVQRRRGVEATPFRLHADEIDYLGFYVSHGMRFDAEEFKGMHAVGLSGFSDDVDRWVYEKFELGRQVDPPRPPMPDAFSDFLRDVELTGDHYRTDCAIALLELSSFGREQFIEMVAQTKRRSIEDKGLHSLSLILKDGKRGFSFLSLHANMDRARLFEQTAAFAMMKKYEARCDEWTGFGWDISSSRVVDVTFFVSQAWAHDAQVERLVRETLRPGHRVETLRTES